MCVRERERERKREGGREGEREGEPEKESKRERGTPPCHVLRLGGWRGQGVVLQLEGVGK